MLAKKDFLWCNEISCSLANTTLLLAFNRLLPRQVLLTTHEGFTLIAGCTNPARTFRVHYQTNHNYLGLKGDYYRCNSKQCAKISLRNFSKADLWSHPLHPRHRDTSLFWTKIVLRHCHIRSRVHSAERTIPRQGIG